MGMQWLTSSPIHEPLVDPSWRELLGQVIYWYLRGDTNDVGPDGACILLQVALERLAWHLLVRAPTLNIGGGLLQAFGCGSPAPSVGSVLNSSYPAAGTGTAKSRSKGNEVAWQSKPSPKFGIGSFTLPRAAEALQQCHGMTPTGSGMV